MLTGIAPMQAQGLPLLEVVRIGDVEGLENALADARQRGALQAVLGERDLRRQTALHAAAAAGQWEMVSLLVDYGASVNALDGGGESPLHKAAGSGHAETVRALLNAGAENVPDRRGQTALYKAAHRGQADVVQVWGLGCRV
jgi:ankyrin repeat protein